MNASPSSRRLTGWLWSLIRPFGARVILSILLGALTVMSSIALMMTSAWLISKCALQPSIADLGVSVVGVRFFGIVRGVFRYLERLVSHDTTFRILAALRVDFYRTIEPLAPACLSRFRTGDLLARVVGDVEALQEVYLRVIAPPAVAVIVAAGTVALFAAYNVTAALALLVFMTLTGLILPVFVRQNSQRAGRALVEARSALHAALVDSIQGMAESLAYGDAPAQREVLDALAGDVARQQHRLNRIESVQAGAMILLVNGAALTVLIAALPYVEGIYLAGLTLGVFAAFEALMPLPLAAAGWDASLASARRLLALTEATPAVIDPAEPAPPPETFALQISNLTMRYAPDHPPVFAGLDLAVRQGERIAILGDSGSGKSTLVNVLTRFWDYESGTIQIGGVDLRCLAQEDARRLIGVMAQQTTLFNTSILENIRLAHPEATDAEVQDAAIRAQIHDFIESLPLGYDTPVGEQGAQLSGGERRRVALARVLLKDAPILVLDEPTAYLDTPTERALLKTVFETLENRTLILLTHRRTLLDRCDQVYRVEGKRLILSSPPA